MSKLTATEKNVLQMVADIEGVPTEGAYNVRVNGESVGRQSTKNITVAPNEAGNGLVVHIAPETKNEVVHIPVVISESGLEDLVYNDFYIGENADVIIIAGCGIHNSGHHRSQHDGIHTFHVGVGARVRYSEKHYGAGDGDGERILNPVTVVHLAEDSTLEMESVQIEGVTSTKRETKGILGDNATLIVKEKLMTSGHQYAETFFDVQLNGENCSTTVSSRSVAKDESKQVFLSKIDGNNACAGHSECDAIIMDNACVQAIPEVTANHVDASLIHEAAIGKIAGEQIVKLLTLGLDEESAEAQIINGFLK
ncbi:MAG: SufB/SufD family protein [Christensenellaceae bacterium]|jgi:Fe-S cluster assembly scaffold protein SufB